jgi:hypothetical protein
MKPPHRPGDAAPNSGTRGSFNMDQGTRDRLTWAGHFAKRLLNTDAGHSVLMRRAIEVYTQHLERLAKKNSGDAAKDQQKLDWEAHALKRAARGEQDALPKQDLIAVPVKLFSEIQAEENKRHG